MLSAPHVLNATDFVPDDPVRQHPGVHGPESGERRRQQRAGATRDRGDRPQARWGGVDDLRMLQRFSRGLAYPIVSPFTAVVTPIVSRRVLVTG